VTALESPSLCDALDTTPWQLKRTDYIVAVDRHGGSCPAIANAVSLQAAAPIQANAARKDVSYGR
jgi:hypothetical protein